MMGGGGGKGSAPAQRIEDLIANVREELELHPNGAKRIGGDLHVNPDAFHNLLHMLVEEGWTAVGAVQHLYEHQNITNPHAMRMQLQ